jgi:predicted AAA+ superfamily ATPase
MFNNRYLQTAIAADAKTKMVFIGGPRQVGKTTLAQTIGKTYNAADYLNWDSRPQRQHILAEEFAGNAQLLIFDELHKYRQWKSYIKGIYDTQKDHYNIIVTGSARLDLYKKGGDSLLGRYYYYRLHPFSVAELLGKQKTLEPFTPLSFPDSSVAQKHFIDLLQFSGFPEPLFARQLATLRRWQNTRLDRLIKEDIRDTTTIHDLSALQILADNLPQKVGAQLSLNALREDLSVAHKTHSTCMYVLEHFYNHYRVYPWFNKTFASLKKEPKLYLWDWTQIENPGARFENIIASHLLKFVHWLYDAAGYKAELHYLRDTQGREVDFLITVNKKPWFAVEAKLSDTAPSAHLQYYEKKLGIPYRYQVVQQPGVDLHIKNIRVISAATFCAGLV